MIMLISSVQLLSCVRLFVTPRTAAHQTSLFIINSRSLPKLMSIESVMPFNHLILCHPILPPPSIFSSIRIFSDESVFCIRLSKYWTFSFKSFQWTFRTDLLLDGLAGSPCWVSMGFSSVFSNTTVQKHQFFGPQLSLWPNSHIHTWLLEKA